MNVEELLKKRGLSKAAFADMIGAKRQNINSLLKNPTLESIEKFAKALDVETWELFASKEEIIKEDENVITCPICGTKIEFKKKD
jgi:transcriptional regulator with XRE-family HTH domain